MFDRDAVVFFRNISGNHTRLLWNRHPSLSSFIQQNLSPSLSLSHSSPLSSPVWLSLSNQRCRGIASDRHTLRDYNAHLYRGREGIVWRMLDGAEPGQSPSPAAANIPTTESL